MTSHNEKCLPKRIILVRHGESQGNRDGTAYTVTPDYKIPLTALGLQQSKIAGEKIRRVISNDDRQVNWKVYFYVSPYERTRATLREIGRSFSRKSVIGGREEVRIREQDFGNFQESERMKAIKQTREKYGRFFYRFPEGESAADVFDRVSGFLESLWRDIDMNRLHHNPADDLNLIIVSHGLASRVFLMRWFKWTVQQFEYLINPGNAEFRVMQLGRGGDYSLAIYHSEEEMAEWGMSPEMIANQQFRARACRDTLNYKSSWYLNSFFEESSWRARVNIQQVINGPDKIVEKRPDDADSVNGANEEDLEKRPDEEVANRNEDNIENKPGEEVLENGPDEEPENRPDEKDLENKEDEEDLQNRPDEEVKNRPDENDEGNRADEEDLENKPGEEGLETERGEEPETVDLENNEDKQVLEKEPDEKAAELVNRPDEEFENGPEENFEELENRTDRELQNNIEA
ncbi:hypothetical protein ACET3Z_021870 [Daucus carota]